MIVLFFFYLADDINFLNCTLLARVIDGVRQLFVLQNSKFKKIVLVGVALDYLTGKIDYQIEEKPVFSTLKNSTSRNTELESVEKFTILS